MRIFVICPVRNISDEDRVFLEDYIDFLEQAGHEVHYPARDTNQDDSTGDRICADNLAALKLADMVCILWDGASQGVLFDAGMAFALGKRIRIIDVPEPTPGKSFQNMLLAWEEAGDPFVR